MPPSPPHALGTFTPPWHSHGTPDGTFAYSSYVHNPTPEMGLQEALAPHWASPARKADGLVDGLQIKAQYLAPAEV